MRKRLGTGTIVFMPDPLTVASIRGGVVEAVGQADRNTYKTVAGTATGGRFVDAVTPGSFLINISGAGSVVCVGLAIHDAAANTSAVTVAHHGIWYVRASGAVTAGSRLITGALGVAVAAGATPDARTVVAIAQEDGVNGTDFRAKLVL